MRVTSVISSISVIETRVGIRVASITISQPGVSLSLGLRLSISRPLAVVVAMMSIGVSSIGSVAISVGVASKTISQPRDSLSLGLGLSLSRPLSVVKTMMSIGVPVSIGSVASVSVGVSVAIGQPGVSLSLR